jgi:hypothetical protein
MRGALVAAPAWALLVVAWLLTPQHSGYGTHEELGLPACSFLTRTGLPCPSCGLTTAVSATAHGRAGLALRAQPFGVLLFLAIAAGAILGGAELATGRSILHVLRPRLWWLAAALAAWLAGWGIAIAAGLAAGRLPIH